MSSPPHADLTFPPGFLWGAATSSHQIEGQNSNSDWWEWEQRIQPPEKQSRDACDAYHRFDEDAHLIKTLGHTAHRLSIEWSRIEPEDGIFCEQEIEHYRKVLMSLKAQGIQVMLTLHHFTNPLWFAQRGGWCRRDAPRRFERFVRYVAPRLGDLVDFWITVNEPDVFAFLGYGIGKWPPQRKNLLTTARVMWHMARAHARAYRVIHRLFPDAKVGIAHNVTSYEALHQHSLRELIATYLSDLLNNHSFYWLSGKHTHDFLGINYYFNRYIHREDPHIIPRLLDIAVTKKEVSDMSWEIHPHGMFRILMDLADLKKPIYITENGIATTDDVRRTRYLLSYLKEIYHAIQAGAPIKGYFHWSLMDNFEWADGFDPRFGLVAIEGPTHERTPRPTAWLYRDIIRNNAIPHAFLKYLGHAMEPYLPTH